MKIKRKDFLDIVFSVEIILLPFLYQYKGVGNVLSFGELMLIPVIVLLFLNPKKIRYVKPDVRLALFYAVTLFTSLLCGFSEHFDFSAMTTTAVRLIFYAIVIYLGRTHFCYRTVSRFYCKLCTLFSLYLIVQYFYHYTTGGYLPIYLSHGLQFPPEARAASLAKYYQWGFRASSLFLEPSYFSFYVLPSAAILLFAKNKTPAMYAELGLIMVAILFSTASSGVVGLILILGCYVFLSTNGKSTFVRVGTVLIIATAAVLYLTLAESASFFQNRLGSSGSINQRIVRGILVYEDLPLMKKLLGVGLNNLEPYMVANQLSTPFDEENLNYCCSLIQTLIYSGFAGFVALGGYLNQLRKTCWRSESDSNVLKALFVLVVFYMLYESILFSYRFCFITVIITGISKNQGKRDWVSLSS